MTTLTVATKVIGHKSAPLSEFAVPLPPDGPPAPTLRELLAFLVEREVTAFHERQAEIARQVGMLEVGLAVQARRQQHHARRLCDSDGQRSGRTGPRPAAPLSPGRVDRRRCGV